MKNIAKDIADVIRLMRALIEDPSIVRFIHVPEFNQVCFELKLPYRLARIEGEDGN